MWTSSCPGQRTSALWIWWRHVVKVAKLSACSHLPKCFTIPFLYCCHESFVKSASKLIYFCYYLWKDTWKTNRISNCEVCKYWGFFVVVAYMFWDFRSFWGGGIAGLWDFKVL
jgi:hypothetical protein